MQKAGIIAGLLLVILLGLIALAVGLQIWTFARRNRYLTVLAVEGVSASGVVTRKSNKALGKITSPCLRYTFRGPDGRPYRQEITVAPEVWSHYKVGMPIDIVYLPNQPAINSVQYLVAEIRKVMQTSS
jgi:hypothetical protein